MLLMVQIEIIDNTYSLKKQILHWFGAFLRSIYTVKTKSVKIQYCFKIKKLLNVQFLWMFFHFWGFWFGLVGRVILSNMQELLWLFYELSNLVPDQFMLQITSFLSCLFHKLYFVNCGRVKLMLQQNKVFMSAFQTPRLALIKTLSSSFKS